MDGEEAGVADVVVMIVLRATGSAERCKSEPHQWSYSDNERKPVAPNGTSQLGYLATTPQPPEH